MGPPPRDVGSSNPAQDAALPGAVAAVRRQAAPRARDAGMHQTVERAFSLLERLWESGKPVNLARVSRATGLDRSVVHRLLASLVALGYVHKDPGTKLYVLGHMSYRLGTRSHLLATITHHARSFIRRLSAELGEAVLLGALEGTQAVYYDRVLPGEDMPASWSHADLSVFYDAHATAVGKVLLANKTRAELGSLYQQRPLARHTGRTIVSHAALLAELSHCRRRGFAIEDAELLPWRRGVAAPIVNPRGTATMAVAVVGPGARLTDARLPIVAKACVATAEAIKAHIVRQQDRSHKA